MKKIKKYEEGSKKIKVSDSNEYVFLNNEWKFVDKISEEIKNIIEQYVTKNNVKLILDDISQKFIKGHINRENKIVGARIKHLPDGKELARGGFSIFAKNLIINDNKEYLWDICYDNTSGLRTYLYSIDKVNIEKEKKAEHVDKFAQHYIDINLKIEKDLIQTSKIEFLALYTLLKTYIRVGNLHYYNNLGHKGLTTLQKRDIKIDSKKKICSFNFIGKDGVPQKIEKEFPEFYIKILKKRLKEIKDDEFVFVYETSKKPIHSSTFSNILFKYTNEHFYPHIIRSFYADLTVKRFLDNYEKENSNDNNYKNKKDKKKVSKKEVEECFLEVAQNLGHKKYNKKKNDWEINFKVTIENYIRPEYVKKMMDLYKNSEKKKPLK